MWTIRQATINDIDSLVDFRIHASENGVGIYLKLGFKPDNSEMVLNLT